MTTSKTDLEGSIQEHDEQIDKKVTQEGQNTKDYVRKVLTNTSFKYLGISFLLTYHYILWFIPDSFFGTELLNDQVTEAWLVNLLAGSITMLFTAFLIKRGGASLRQQEPCIRHSSRLSSLLSYLAVLAGFSSNQFIDVCSCLRRGRP